MSKQFNDSSAELGSCENRQQPRKVVESMCPLCKAPGVYLMQDPLERMRLNLCSRCYLGTVDSLISLIGKENS